MITATPIKTPVIPGAPAPQSVPENPPPWTGGMLKGTRQSIVQAIGASGLTASQKALLMEEIGKIPAQFDLLRVDFDRRDYNAGTNTTFTITEL